MDANIHNLAAAVQRVGLPAVVAPAQELPAKAGAVPADSMPPEVQAQSIPVVVVVDHMIVLQ
jgi:hypothetical protein